MVENMGHYRRSSDTSVKPRFASRHRKLYDDDIIWVDYGEIRELSIEDARWLGHELLQAADAVEANRDLNK